MNLLDKIISAVSPETAYRRAQYRDAMTPQAAVWGSGAYTGGGYEAGDFGRERWMAGRNRAWTADEEYHLNAYDRQSVVLTCQDLYRNNEIAHGLINRIADYVVHTGIRPQAQTSSKDWNDEAEGWFGEWAKIADYRRRPGTDFYRLQWMKMVDRYIHGESGDIITESGQLQPIEMDRVATPVSLQSKTTIRSGVRFDSTGKLVSYYICDQTPQGMVDLEHFVEVPASDFIHVMWPWRVNQARGVPELAACIGKISDLKETDKYTLLKCKNDAKLFLKRTRDQGGNALSGVGPRGTTIMTDSAGNKTALEHHDWGEVFNGNKGEDIQSFRSETPNTSYVPYLELQCKMLGASLGIPWEFILMVFTAGSFSAQRSALMHMLHKIMGMHADLSRIYCQRVWNWRIAKAMKYGDISKAPTDKRGVSEWYKVQWSLPNMGWVDPEAAIQGDKTAWQLGVRSLKSIIGGYGEDRDDTFADKGSDIAAAGDVADDLNKNYPNRTPVTWRDIINDGSSGAQKMAQTADARDQADADETKQTEGSPNE
jgi:lambda family phage portal protein